MNISVKHKDGTITPAKFEPYHNFFFGRIKCALGFHELHIDKHYRGTKTCFRCGKRKTGLSHY